MHKTKFSNMDSDSILHASYIQHCRSDYCYIAINVLYLLLTIYRFCKLVFYNLFALC